MWTWKSIITKTEDELVSMQTRIMTIHIQIQINYFLVCALCMCCCCCVCRCMYTCMYTCVEDRGWHQASVLYHFFTLYFDTMCLEIKDFTKLDGQRPHKVLLSLPPRARITGMWCQACLFTWMLGSMWIQVPMLAQHTVYWLNWLSPYPQVSSADCSDWSAPIPLTQEMLSAVPVHRGRLFCVEKVPYRVRRVF